MLQRSPSAATAPPRPETLFLGSPRTRSATHAVCRWGTHGRRGRGGTRAQDAGTHRPRAERPRCRRPAPSARGRGSAPGAGRGPAPPGPQRDPALGRRWAFPRRRPGGCPAARGPCPWQALLRSSRRCAVASANWLPGARMRFRTASMLSLGRQRLQGTGWADPNGGGCGRLMAPGGRGRLCAGSRGGNPAASSRRGARARSGGYLRTSL